MSSFKEFLVSEVRERRRLRALISDNPIDASTTYEEILDILPAINERSRALTRTEIDKTLMLGVVERMRQARSIESMDRALRIRLRN